MAKRLNKTNIYNNCIENLPVQKELHYKTKQQNV